MTDDPCRSARLYFDARLAEDIPEGGEQPELRKQIEQHLIECDACLAWQRQTTELIAVAAQVPQFDVPEALTQRILKEAMQQQSRKDSIFASTVAALVAVCALSVLLFVDRCETTTGVMSWLLGMATMAAFAKFVSEPVAAAPAISEGRK